MHYRRLNIFRKTISISLALFLFALFGCGSSSDSASQAPVVSVCAMSSTDNASISGTVTFDRVYHTGNALDYNKISSQSVRGAVVEVICQADGFTLVSGITDNDGNYDLNLPSDSKKVFVRVKAQMKNDGTPAWNFKVVDNTQKKALYVLDGSPFDLDTDPVIRNLHAPSGWNGSSYASVRAAAPFAILDSIYDAFQKVLLSDPDAIFPPLKVNWSKKNIAIPGVLSSGQINSSFFNGNEIYLLGAENNDTDEYDDHVVIHEFGHYLETSFSRSDSIGGSHSQNNRLDIRVAFSEGFANAFSGIVSDDPVYRDSNGINQGNGFGCNVENNNCLSEGWYSECSVQAIVYDLYDNASDIINASEIVDTLGFGFTPVFDVLINEQKNTSAMISIFSFIYQFKQKNSAEASDIDALVSAQGIDVISDIYGDSETGNNPGTTNVLPVHGQIAVNGASVNVCSTGEFKVFNGLGLYRLLRFTMPASQRLTIRAIKTSGPGNNPDINLYQKGQLVSAAESKTLSNETLKTPLLGIGKTYVIEVYEFGNVDAGVGATCFDVSVST